MTVAGFFLVPKLYLGTLFVPAKFHFALFNFCHPELVEGSAPGTLAIIFL
jgi:hypothetical protein